MLPKFTLDRWLRAPRSSALRPPTGGIKMKKLLVLALAMGLLIVGLGVSAGSADAACGTKCLSKKVKNLQNQVATLNAQLSCISTSVPVTRYFGYDYLSTSSTTALDQTDPGDPVDF